jgi:hypothetical protein
VALPTREIPVVVLVPPTSTSAVKKNSEGLKSGLGQASSDPFPSPAKAPAIVPGIRNPQPKQTHKWRSWAGDSSDTSNAVDQTIILRLYLDEEFFIMCGEPGFVDDVGPDTVNVVCKRCNNKVGLHLVRSSEDEIELRWSQYEKTCGKGAEQEAEIDTGQRQQPIGSHAACRAPKAATKVDRAQGQPAAEKHAIVTARTSIPVIPADVAKRTTVETAQSRMSPRKSISGGMMKSKYASKNDNSGKSETGTAPLKLSLSTRLSRSKDPKPRPIRSKQTKPASNQRPSPGK